LNDWFDISDYAAALIQTAPQPPAKQRRLGDDEIDTQGTYCIIEITAML